MADDFGGAIGGALQFIGQIDANNTAKQIATSNQNFQEAFSDEVNTAANARAEYMRSTAYQATVKDLMAAGLNPMLAYERGPTPTPGAADAMASPPPQRPYTSPISAGLSGFLSSAISLAEKDKKEAETKQAETQADKNTAEADEARARTPTYQVSIDQMNANIQRTQEEIKKVIQDTSTSAATAANVRQQTINLQAVLPQIRATVDQLRAQTKLTGTIQGLNETQTTKLRQEIAANLPALEAALKQLEARHSNLGLPKAGMDAAVNDSPIGAVSAVLRALNPLAGLIQVAK